MASPGVPAYKAVDLRNPGNAYFALVPDPQLPMRVAALTTLKLIRNPAVLTPVDTGTVHVASMQRNAEVLVFEQPLGGRLIEEEGMPLEPWNEDQIAEKLLTPILPAMRAFMVEGITHRAIRPTNILFPSPARSQAILGDCISAPAGLYQPAAYETIENMMASPIGRGSGTFADDFYALGATIVYLHTGMPPGEGRPDEDLLERKLQFGSFAALSGDRHLSGRVSELVRGLLLDEPGDRWAVQELEHWLNGRRMNVKTSVGAGKASRPFEVNGIECWSTRQLAQAITKSSDGAMDALMGSGLANWLSRSLSDKHIAVRVLQATMDEDSGAFQSARKVARVAIVLDPPAPLRYRGLSLFSSGIGPALAAAMMRGGEVNAIAEIIRTRLVQFWCRQQRPSRWSDYLPQISRDFDKLYNWLSDTKYAYGIERVVYELNPKLHCLSPLIETAHITTLEELMPALERAAAAGAIEFLPIDRHIAAFIARNIRRIDDKLWISMSNPDPTIRLLSMLYALALLQAEYGPNSLPALSRVFAKQAKMFIERFRNRKTRQKMQDKLEEEVASGQLTRLVQYLDNPEDHQKDADEFAAARAEFTTAQAGIAMCERRKLYLREETVDTAGSLSMILSGIVSILAFGLYFAWG
jgi:hypothetical protein